MESDGNMSTSVEVAGVMASPGEGDDVFGDDSRLDKKKKFKPFQKMKNFFRGSSKKRFKPEETQKAHSTSALHHGAADGVDDDDGGFRPKSHVLAGSRSISEDSIFKPETKEPTPGVLENKTVSMENIETNPFQTELFMKLKSRQSDSDIDEGLPYSPITTLTPHGLMFDMTHKSVPATTGKSTSQESEQSLISVDSSEEDLFSSNWKSGVASVRTARSSSMDSLPENQMDVSDFESVQLRTSSLSNEAAKHRISVKPKSRRLSSKLSMKRRDRSPAPPQLADVKEESPNKTPTASETTSSVPQKTVISTTIPVGLPSDTSVNVIPRSEPRAIPAKPEVKEMAKSEPRDIVTRHGEDIDRSRPRSLSPLSTSPVSQSMIQDVKLRSRPTSGKFDGVDVKKDSPENPDNELTKAFNRAKRISKKFDDDGNVIDTNGKPTMKVQQNEPEKPAEMSKSVILPKEQSKNVGVSSPVKDTPSPTSGSSSSSGVSFVLKKEPLRPGNKQDVSAAKSVEVKELSKVAPVVDAKTTVTDVPVKSSGSSNTDIKKDTVIDTNSPAKTVKIGSPEKLASPREEYRLKRAARSKTLPVSTDMIEKAEEADKASGSNRLGSPPLRSRARNDYDNVSLETKPSTAQSKRSSWASSSVTTATSSSTPEPAWVVRARLKKMEQEEKEKSDVAKEVKIDIKGTNNNSVNKNDKSEMVTINKISDKTQSEQKTDLPKSTVQTSSVKSWGQTYTAKPFEKPTSSVTAKSSTEKNVGVIGVGAKASFDKPSVQSVKPPVTATSEQFPLSKTSVTTSGVKPSVSLGTKPAFNSASKPTVSSISKPAVSNFTKPLISSSSKSTVSTASSSFVDKSTPQTSKSSGTTPCSNSDKPSTQSVRGDGKVSGFGGVSATAGFSRSFSQKNGSTPVQKTSLDNKPTQSLTNKSLKTDSKDAGSKPPVSSISKDNKKTDNDNKNTSSVSSTVKSGSVFEKTKPAFGNSKPDTSSSVPAWKQALNQKKSGSSQGQVKIEIIDKGTDTKPPQKKVDEKQSVQIREKPKTTPEKCSDISSNRPSKVLDMVKSFQKLQVT